MMCSKHSQECEDTPLDKNVYEQDTSNYIVSNILLDSLTYSNFIDERNKAQSHPGKHFSNYILMKGKKFQSKFRITTKSIQRVQMNFTYELTSLDILTQSVHIGAVSNSNALKILFSGEDQFIFKNIIGLINDKTFKANKLISEVNSSNLDSLTNEYLNLKYLKWQVAQKKQTSFENYLAQNQIKEIKNFIINKFGESNKWHIFFGDGIFYFLNINEPIPGNKTFYYDFNIITI